MRVRPKRRKMFDNPYTLTEYENNTYYVTFKDSIGIIRTIEINKNIFDAFDRFELDDLKILNENDNHKDFRTLNNSEIEENNAYNNSYKNESLEDEVERRIFNDELYFAINSLNDLQKNRVKKYYFEDKTLQQIADEEGCSPRAVKYSIDHAIENLRKFFDN